MTRRNERTLLALVVLFAAVLAPPHAAWSQSAECANPWWNDYPTDRGRTYVITIENVTGGELILNFTRYFDERDQQGRCVRRSAAYPNAQTEYTVATDETRTLTLANFPGCALRTRLRASEGMLNVFVERELGRISLSVYGCSGDSAERSKDAPGAALNRDIEVSGPDTNGGDECPCDCSLGSPDGVCVGLE